MVRMARCLYKLYRLEECDAALEKGYHRMRDCWREEEGEAKGQQFLENYYRNIYSQMGLDAYRVCPY